MKFCRTDWWPRRLRFSLIVSSTCAIIGCTLLFWILLASRTLDRSPAAHATDNADRATLSTRSDAVMAGVAHASHSKIHICLTFDENYSVGAIALINSTILHCSRPHALVFHIVTHDKVDSALRDSLHEHFPQPEFSFSTLDVTHVRAATVWAAYRAASLGKPIVFARYVLPALFPTLDRLVYLDQDVLVRRDVAPLYDMDLEGHPIAAARLCRESALFGKQLDMRQPELAQLNPMQCSLNNGVLVYDMNKWRRANYTAQLFRWTRLNNERKLYKLGSQPPFNLVFGRNYKLLDKYWNMMDLAGLSDQYGPTTASAHDVLDSAIIHWNGQFKPWMCSEGFYAELWRQYFPGYREAVAPLSAEVKRQVCDAAVITDLDLRLDDPASQFTVIITSHLRVDNLAGIANHLLRSDYVKEILLVWNNAGGACPTAVQGLMRCLPQTHNYVHNRFAVWDEVTTDAVLQHDDDILIPLHEMEDGFKIWRKHSDQLLGFQPRVVRCVMGNSANCSYSFIMRDGYYDVVIGKLFFVSNKYQRAFMAREDLIALTSRVPCEDLAMNYMVAEMAGNPALWFKANLTEVRSVHYEGLSQGIESAIWRNLRRDCINELYRAFGRHTVIPATVRYAFSRDTSRVLKQSVVRNESWCSDTHGGRICRQP
eukprot:Opistho-2@90398